MGEEVRKYVGRKKLTCIHTRTHSLKHTHYFVAWGEFERSAEREIYNIEYI